MTAEGSDTAKSTDDQFALTCATLAGTHDISPPLMAGARKALQAALGDDAIDALVAAIMAPNGKDLSPLIEGIARQLLTMLYTGQLDPWGAGTPSKFYTSALAWQVLEFASTPGSCGLGDWSTAPAA